MYCVYNFCKENELKLGNYYEPIELYPRREMLLVRNEQGNRVHYPVSYFANKPLHHVVEWRSEVELTSDVRVVEIDVILSDGSERWILFATPDFIKEELDRNEVEPAFYCRNMVLVSGISHSSIDAGISYLESCGALMSQSKLLKKAPTSRRKAKPRATGDDSGGVSRSR